MKRAPQQYRSDSVEPTTRAGVRRAARLGLLSAGSAALLALAACSDGGGITVPTSIPSVTVPTVTLPTVTVPTVTLPTVTLPTVTIPAATPPTRTAQTTADSTPTTTTSPPDPTTTTSPPDPPTTVTTTQTQTVTATQTQTQTQTVTVSPSTTPTSTTSTTTAPTTTTSTTTPPTTSTTTTVPAEPTSSSTTWWPWLLLALVALGALAWWLLARSRRNAVLAAWDDQLAAACREASWVEDSLVPQVLARPSTTEAAAVWDSAQPRLLAVDEQLHSLEGQAPDETRGASVGPVRTAYTRLLEEVSADTAAPPDASADDFRVRRAAIDTARQDLREVLATVTASDQPHAHRA